MVDRGGNMECGAHSVPRSAMGESGTASLTPNGSVGIRAPVRAALPRKRMPGEDSKKERLQENADRGTIVDRAERLVGDVARAGRPQRGLPCPERFDRAVGRRQVELHLFELRVQRAALADAVAALPFSGALRSWATRRVLAIAFAAGAEISRRGGHFIVTARRRGNKHPCPFRPADKRAGQESGNQDDRNQPAHARTKSDGGKATRRPVVSLTSARRACFQRRISLHRLELFLLAGQKSIASVHNRGLCLWLVMHRYCDQLEGHPANLA